MIQTSNNVNSDDEIDIKQIIKQLIKWKTLIILLTVVLALTGYLVAKVKYKPTYQASGTFMSKPNANASTGTAISSSDIIMSQQLANTFKVVLLSKNMLDIISTEINNEEDSKFIKEAITIDVVKSSQIMKITATTMNPDLSARIVNAILTKAPGIINEKIKMGSMMSLNNARVPNSPVKDTDRTLFPVIGAIMGFLISAGIALVAEMFSKTVKSPYDIKNLLGQDLLGTVPSFEELKANVGKKKPPFVIFKTANFAYIEAYKSIRTKIENLKANRHYKTFLITSTKENEGKTTVAINIATVLAQKGNKVLFIDGDLRKSYITKLLGIPLDEANSIINVIKGTVEITSAIKLINPFGFYVLLSLSFSEDASEILASDEMANLLIQLRETYDYIIIDTPPASIISDAMVLSEISDAIIYVVRENHSAIELINQTIGEFTDSKALLAGCILNDSRYTDSVFNTKKYYKGYGK